MPSLSPHSSSLWFGWNIPEFLIEFSIFYDETGMEEESGTTVEIICGTGVKEDDSSLNYKIFSTGLFCLLLHLSSVLWTPLLYLSSSVEPEVWVVWLTTGEGKAQWVKMEGWGWRDEGQVVRAATHCCIVLVLVRLMLHAGRLLGPLLQFE